MTMCASCYCHQLSSFDVDGDGKVSAEELSEVVEQLMRDEAESGRINVTRFSSHIKSKVREVYCGGSRSEDICP